MSDLLMLYIILLKFICILVIYQIVQSYIYNYNIMLYSDVKEDIICSRFMHNI